MEYRKQTKFDFYIYWKKLLKNFDSYNSVSQLTYTLNYRIFTKGVLKFFSLIKESGSFKMVENYCIIHTETIKSLIPFLSYFEKWWNTLSTNQLLLIKKFLIQGARCNFNLKCEDTSHDTCLKRSLQDNDVHKNNFSL